jgi:hypothetical protein
MVRTLDMVVSLASLQTTINERIKMSNCFWQQFLPLVNTRHVYWLLNWHATFVLARVTLFPLCVIGHPYGETVRILFYEYLVFTATKQIIVD